MLVTLRANETWQGELDATVTWRHPLAGEYGDAELHIPAGHPALAVDDDSEPRYVSNDGGFWVEIMHDALGVWRGIADVPEVDDSGATIACYEISAITTIRRVGNAGTLHGLPAGTIVQHAYQQAFGGLGRAAIGLGDVTASGPLIIGYAFQNQTLADVLQDMSTMTGQEWDIDDEARLNWHGFGGRYYPFPLADDGDLVDSKRSGTITSMAISVTARNDLGMELTATSLIREAGALWPAMEVVSP